jgi:UDP-N-acetyl-D-glucosamine/UDP-N-acetyl-D-galactosamine dehydrogenase
MAADHTKLNATIGVVGLGYVGLPLAVAFGRRFATIGFDADATRIEGCTARSDVSGQVSAAEFREAERARFTKEPSALAACDIVVICVPTPVSSARQPDFGPLTSASETVGRAMKKGATVVYESTVYPGATEEVCVPVLERASSRRWKRDFHVAYSPERINPGDREHTLARIVKVVAGDSPETLEMVARLYEAIIPAGVHRTSSIRVAEAAKVIENTQRDLNIALVNELAIIFHRLGLDTTEVLQAAGTKWNFLPFRPGLVGGHCIGVDPYYLTHKAESVGYHPEVILAGRRINDGMGRYVAEQTVKRLIQRGCYVKGAKVNVVGLTFKEDVPDLRNSKVVDVIDELKSFGIEVHVHDPIASAHEALEHYGITLEAWAGLPAADALIVAVPHAQVLARPLDEFLGKLTGAACFIDVKARFPAEELRRRGADVWRL